MSIDAPPLVRPAARVVLADSRDRILLLHCEDSTIDVPVLWLTPGGACEAGENSEEAAREPYKSLVGSGDLRKICMALPNSIGAFDGSVARDQRFVIHGVMWNHLMQLVGALVRDPGPADEE